jgi:3-oxoacyl-[acyl-carrier protein] reductase
MPKQNSSPEKNSLTGKTVLVTGASRGIGRGIALEFAKRGAARIAFTYLSSKKEAAAVEKELHKYGAEVLAVQADVARLESVTQMVEKVIQAFGTIDVLVNNAGIYEAAPFENMKEEMWDRILNTNLKGMFHCAQAVYPSMKKKQSGKIINIASIMAFFGSAAATAYSASKAGVVSLTKSLAKELGPHGITVNAIAPGLVDTGSLDLEESELQKVRKVTPLRRVATPEDIARAAAFFASEDADFITGQTLIVDGGRL